jgi:hypothetical protein
MQGIKGLQQELKPLPAVLLPVLGLLVCSLSAGLLLLLVQLCNSTPARWGCSCHVVNLLQQLPMMLIVWTPCKVAMQQQSQKAMYVPKQQTA